MARGAVLGPPYTAARALIEWAIELWPYVNGKCIFNHIQLEEIPAHEMVDVLHFLFEEDLDATSGEQAEAQTKARELIYNDLYGEKYKYGVKSSQNKYNTPGYTPDNDGFYGQEVDDIQVFDPMSQPTKPYVPPTDFEENSSRPFGGLLDEPLV